MKKIILGAILLGTFASSVFAGIEGTWIGKAKVEGVSGETQMPEFRLTVNGDGTFKVIQKMPSGEKLEGSGVWKQKDDKVLLTMTRSKGQDIPTPMQKVREYKLSKDGNSFWRDMSDVAKGAAYNKDASGKVTSQQEIKRIKVILTYTRAKS